MAGEPFDPELVAAVAAVPEPAAIDALDELLRLDLVRGTDVPRRFRFRHPLVRRAVYEATPGGWRLGAHERTAQALASRGAPAAARAHHLEHSARTGDAAAVAVLRDAGETTAQRAPASAARWFGAALRILPANAPAHERTALQLSAAQALVAAGRFGEAHALLLESLAGTPPDDEALRVRLVTACASVEHLLARHDDAQRRLSEVLEGLAEPRSALGAGVMIELAIGSMFRAEYDAMRDWAVRARDSAQDLTAPELDAAALALVALARGLSGDVPGSRRHREAAAELVDRLGDDALARRLDALVHLATAEMYLDLFESSGRHAERALAIGRATGQGDQFPLLMPMFGTSLWVQGRAKEACEVFDGATEAARLIDSAQGVAWSLFNLSFAALAAGDVDQAYATAEEARELARELDSAMIAGHAAWAAAAALMERGKAGEAAQLMLEETGGPELTAVPGGWRAVALELLTRALLTAGRRPEAERSAAAARACADAVGLPMAAAMADLCDALLHLDGDDPAAAVDPALRAAAALEEVGNTHYAALARLRGGHALRLSGRREGRGRRAAAGRGRLRRPRLSAQTRGGRAGVAPARPSHPAPHTGPRRRGRRLADGARAGGRPPGGRPADQRRDRGIAVPQHQDGRDAPAQRLPQARRVVADRGGAGGGARGRVRRRPAGSQPSGMRPMTRVPLPGVETIVSSPPTAASRSRMLV